MVPWISVGENWENLPFTDGKAIEVGVRRKELTGGRQYLASDAIEKHLFLLLIMIKSEIIRCSGEC